MRIVEIFPYEASQQGSIGRLYIDGQYFCYSMELPWKDNRPNVSCITPDVYTCTWHRSPRYGWVYLVTDVDGRSWILIHPGNFGGDTSAGYRTHTKGCLLLGRKTGYLKVNGIMQRAVLISRPTVRRFFDLMDKEDFKLIIHPRMTIAEAA